MRFKNFLRLWSTIPDLVWFLVTVDGCCIALSQTRSITSYSDMVMIALDPKLHAVRKKVLLRLRNKSGNSDQFLIKLAEKVVVVRMVK